ncbi:MAG: glycosyltransferase [Chitinophagales bacterium]|nr:glycosyltransferase [Chitinophagales bacterium]
MSKTGKVLVLAYDFPPYPSIAGQRPASWLRYFKQLGVEPHVITRHWDVEINSHIDCFRASKNKTVHTEQTVIGTITRVPYYPNIRDRMLTGLGEQRFVFFRKAISFLLEILKFHFFYFDNRSDIFHEARKALQQNRYDAIIATGEPFILFRYASLLSKEFGIPWVADFRDGWSINRINPPKSFAEKLLMRHAHYLENKLIPLAELITTASPSYKNDLQQLFPNKRVEVIYNGFDDDTLRAIPDIQQDKEIFRIAYAGTIYPFQHLESFLEGFRKFILNTNARNVKIIFYGVEFYPEQVQRVLSFDSSLLPYLEMTGKLSYEKVLMNLKQASVLLLLGAKNNNTLSAKIFDYLASERFILFVQNDHGVLQEIMQKSNGGASCENADDVCAALERSYSEHKLKGAVTQNPSGFKEYSRKHQALRLVELLKSI